MRKWIPAFLIALASARDEGCQVACRHKSASYEGGLYSPRTGKCFCLKAFPYSEITKAPRVWLPKERVEVQAKVENIFSMPVAPSLWDNPAESEAEE
jgi:hypothetical protein